ncbi:hypothetical protein LOD99_10767 [Oopsacas minuta]|uniref:OTU domain-containing protein n=1 Tax=Oopsacas minuta TaxID=111878 RepID=A0AAV7KDF9_9METZ|nr:hypothetical protein LOD99_10767 [Oopsacas minuta]
MEQQIQKYQFDDKVKKRSTSIKQGDQILVRNMRKAKKMPGTKKGGKYIGPMTVAKVTESRALVLKEEAKSPKRKFTDIPTDVVTKKFKKSEKEVTMLPGNRFHRKEFIQPKSSELSHLDIHHLESDNPIITPITTEWQKEKCNLLEIQFQQPTDQYSTIVGRRVCLSKLISGSQEYHAKIRGEVCRYMVSDEKDVINWYFNEVLTTTTSHHINGTSMSSNGSWATVAELIAASAQLEADIYVANKIYRTEGSLDTEIRWLRLSASNNYTHIPALYIANYSDHYEPVYNMFNNKNPTFSFSDKNLIEITDS